MPSALPVPVPRLPRQPRKRRRRLALTLVAGIAAGGLVGPVGALADATVVVRVRAAGEAVDGTVTLVAKGSSKGRYQCRTSDGRCTIRGVPGGRYTVRFVPERGESPPERSVMIPPEGEVSLIVSANHR